MYKEEIQKGYIQINGILGIIMLLTAFIVDRVDIDAKASYYNQHFQ